MKKSKKHTLLKGEGTNQHTLYGDFSVEEVANLVSAELFHHKRVLYRVTHSKTAEIFRLGDSATGAMIAAIVADAKSRAMKRDLAANSKKPKGVAVEDFHEAEVL